MKKTKLKIDGQFERRPMMREGDLLSLDAAREKIKRTTQNVSINIMKKKRNIVRYKHSATPEVVFSMRRGRAMEDRKSRMKLAMFKSKVFTDDFYPQTKEEVYEAVKELIRRCDVSISDTDIEFAITESMKAKLYNYTRN